MVSINYGLRRISDPIKTARDLFQFANNLKTSMAFAFDDSKSQKIEESSQKYCNLAVVTGTRSFHHIIPTEGLKLTWKKLSRSEKSQEFTLRYVKKRKQTKK